MYLVYTPHQKILLISCLNLFFLPPEYPILLFLISYIIIISLASSYSTSTDMFSICSQWTCQSLLCLSGMSVKPEKTNFTHQPTEDTQAFFCRSLWIDNGFDSSRSVQSIVLEIRWIDPWAATDKTVRIYPTKLLHFACFYKNFPPLHF